MGVDAAEITFNLIKMIVIFLIMVQLVPILVWVERRGSAFMQNRLGPNRVGPLGLTQLLADAVKFIFKEEFVPSGTRKFLFYAAPVISLIPAAITFGAIPLSVPLEIPIFSLFGESYGPYSLAFQSFKIGIGIVFVLGIASLGAYSILIAGWASNNKYSLYGALRGSAQMISYELALGLSLVGIIMIYGTFDFQTMIDAQRGALNFSWFGSSMKIPFLPNWGIFFQPLGALLFFIAVFAETNRLPFDLPEAEAELVAGYHTEYGGLKMNMFYIGEYGHMMVAAALMAVFYFGGYNLPFIEPIQITEFLNGFVSLGAAKLLTSLILFKVLFIKIFFFLWIFVWVRWTLPRFRFDQLMDLGWKTMLPWALGNTIVTALVIALLRHNWG